MKEPKNKRQVRKFLGGINFYRKMWKSRSHLLAPLADLTGNVPFKWGDKHQQAFDATKAALSKETMLYYLNYNAPFLIFPDALDKQLGGHAT